MIRSGGKHWFVAVLIGIVLGLGGVAGQPAAQAAPGSGVNSEGGYSERRPCADCYDRERACEARRDAPPPCGDCYENRPCSKQCGDEAPCRDCDSARGRCPDCYDRQPRCTDCARDDRYDREKKDRSALHKLLRGVFD